MNLRGKFLSLFKGRVKMEVTQNTTDNFRKNINLFSIPQKASEDILKFIEYPSRPKGIYLFDELEILSVHHAKLVQTQMILGMADNIIDQEAYTFTNLVIRPIAELIRWIHLLPASENHHHNGIGGLLSHSIDVGLLALKNAYETELAPIGYQDEEVERKKRYYYAAFICGLLHDVGKIFDVDIIGVGTDNKAPAWRALSESLMDWAYENNISNYEIHWRSREPNQHALRASIFLERCLNSTCLKYIGTVTRERIFDRMISALSNYAKTDDYLSICIRRADYYSTGTDLNMMTDPIMGRRSADAASRAINTLRTHMKSLNINDYQSSSPLHLFIIGGAVYLNESACIDFILNDFSAAGFNFPSGDIGREALTDILTKRGYIEPYSEERTVHFFSPGKHDSDSIQHLFERGIKNLKIFNLLKVKWTGFIFDSYIIPDSVQGIFAVHETNDYLYVDREGNVQLFKRPKPSRDKVIKISDSQHKPAQLSKSGTKGVSLLPKPDLNTPEEIIDVDLPSLSSESIATDISRENISKKKKTPIKKTTTKKKLAKTEAEIEPVQTAIDRTKYLDQHLMTTPLPDEAIHLVDGIPYVSLIALQQAMGGLEAIRLELSTSFELTYRDGSLDGELIVPDTNGKKLLLLSQEVAGFQLGHAKSPQPTSLQSLLSADLFTTVSFTDNAVDTSELPSTTQPSKTLSMPSERYPDVVTHENNPATQDGHDSSSHMTESIPAYMTEALPPLNSYEQHDTTPSSEEFIDPSLMSLFSRRDNVIDPNEGIGNQRSEKNVTTEAQLNLIASNANPKPQTELPNTPSARLSSAEVTTETVLKSNFADLSLLSKKEASEEPLSSAVTDTESIDSATEEDYKSLAKFINNCITKLTEQEYRQFFRFTKVNEVSLCIKTTAINQAYFLKNVIEVDELTNLIEQFFIVNMTNGKRPDRYHIVNLQRLISAGDRSNIYIPGHLSTLFPALEE